MSQEYSRGILRVAVAQICQNLGWTSIHAMPLELLTDVLERYLLQLGKVTHRYSEQFGRTTPRLDDVSLAFSHMGVKLSELEDFVSHIDSVPFAKETVAFPEPCENDLKFPNPDSKEVQQRKVFEFVPEYLPYMHPELNEDLEEPQPGPVGSPERLQVDAQSQIGEMSPGQGEKRLLSSPGDSGAPFKRPRLTTSQPLPEEAFHSQHEMTSVVMTNSGILSPLREGKLPDSKPPPTGFKQIVVVTGKPKTSSAQATAGVKLGTETPIIKLDFSQETDGPATIVEIGKESGNIKKTGVERKDPDFNPKKKKKPSEVKRSKILKDIKLKKRGPGRPKSPGSAAVVHNKGAAGISKILAISRKDADLSILNEDSENAQDVPVEMPNKPTPSVHNISVHVDESARSKSDHSSQKATDYKPKTVTISKQQEKDMEDTIASVIEKSSREMDNRLSEAVKKERSVSPHERVETKSTENGKDTWRVSHISETYIGDKDDSFENADDDTDSKDEKEKDADKPAYHPPGQYLAPHLAFLQQKSPKPRGRPRGSTKSPMYSSGVARQQKGRKPGRPPLSQSPGRSMSRSPGRPPLSSRSPGPGRPSLKRSPGRPPGSGRSPGRPKGSFSSTHSPKPRGRPRGSKSPRYRGVSPRGGSPRAVANINFDEDVTAINTRILQDHSEASDSKLFDFPDKSSDIDDYGKDRSPTPKLHSKDRPRSSLSPRKDRTPDRRDISPKPLSPTKLSVTVKREPTPDGSNVLRESYSLKRDSSAESDVARKRDRDYDSHSEDRPSSRSDSWKDPVHVKQERSQSREKENRLFPSFKDRSKEREISLEKEPLFKDRDNSSERESSVYSHEREFSREREHKDHSRERDHHSKDRDRDRSKEHRKDKKKKKKKDKDKDREREKDRDKDRKEKHKKDKEPKEEEPSVKPLQKLTIKFGGGSTSSTGFSISKTQHLSSPKREPVSPPQRPEIPKLKFKVLPPKPDSGASKAEPGTQSWKSTIKTESKRTPSPKPEPLFPSHVSPKPEPDVETSKASGLEGKGDGGKEEEVTFSLAVVGGKIMGQKPVKRKRKGSKGKGRAKTEIKRTFITPVSALDENDEDTQPAMESDPDKDPLSPFQTNQNVPSPITIPALKAAPPPPSPPTNKKSPPKSKTCLKETRSQSPPMFKDIGKTKPLPAQITKTKPPPVQVTKTKPPPVPIVKTKPPPVQIVKTKPPPVQIVKTKPSPVQVAKTKPPPVQIVKTKPPPVQIPKSTKGSKSPRRSSPRKSPKISPPIKKKATVLSEPSPAKTPPPPSKSSSFSDSQPPRSPSMSYISSPSFSPPASPMYSPASSPARDSPLHFMIPPTPAFPTRTASPAPSPPSRQLSTDDEKEATPPVDRPDMPPPLPPMPPSASQKKAQRTVVAETVGSFVNECGEKIWICPACTMQDDGSPMIGCDLCDDWYHWVCVNIVEEPSETESWYCPKCVKPSKSKGKRGRKKKKP